MFLLICKMFPFINHIQNVRNMLPRRILYCGGIAVFGVNFFEDHDIVDDNTETRKRMLAHIDESLNNETGWERLKYMLYGDGYELTPEMRNVVTSTTAGLLTGACIGALGASKTEYVNFIEKNKASQFESHYEAKHQLQHKVTKAMSIGGFKIGWRLALFTGFYSFFTTAVSTYRNKSSILEYSLGGLIAGSTYKLPMGPKAMISGGIAGVVLGTVAGGVSVGVMKLTGTTTEELRYWRHNNNSNSEIKSLERGHKPGIVKPLQLKEELRKLAEMLEEPTTIVQDDAKNKELETQKPDLNSVKI